MLENSAHAKILDQLLRKAPLGHDGVTVNIRTERGDLSFTVRQGEDRRSRTAYYLPYGDRAIGYQPSPFETKYTDQKTMRSLLRRLGHYGVRGIVGLEAHP